MFIILIKLIITYIFLYKKNDSLKLSFFYLSPFLYGFPSAAGALELLTNSTNTINVII
mgnify:FL=1